MTIKDTFSYNARWGSVGLDCSTCINFSGPQSWPDENEVTKCKKHNVSLTIELGKNKYKEWEWFCSEYTDNGGFPEAVNHFKEIHDNLEQGVLYRLYGENSCLLEYKINEL